jgi:dTDP-4-amino-4,6-dideoxygalactose transaminase
MIPFNRPHLTGREFAYIEEAVRNGQLAGNGMFTARCQERLEQMLGARRVLLTHSCTAALEMAALLLDLGPGDEVIMPSFTFVSTANAVVLRGATPVFVDIRRDTLNLDERLVEQAITPRTRAIMPVHYAGVACEMAVILDIASRHGLAVIEDAAQGLMSSYSNRPLGSIGDMSAISFHETKNVISGEGGALVINDERLVQRAEILWEKGTDRTRFRRGEIEKYTWVDVGSSFLPGELIAAFLWAQLEDAEQVTAARLALWNQYREVCAPLARAGFGLPWVPPQCAHNAHLFFVVLPPHLVRADVLGQLNTRGVNAVFHYVPLHLSPAGQRFGRVASTMAVTEDVSSRLIRLPLWVGMDAVMVERVVSELAATAGVAAQTTDAPNPVSSSPH